MSRRNRKKRRQIMRQMGMRYERIQRLGQLNYCPLRHLEIQRRFYTQARVIYFALWLHNWLSALSCFSVEFHGVGRINVGGMLARGLFDE